MVLESEWVQCCYSYLLRLLSIHEFGGYCLALSSTKFRGHFGGQTYLIT